MLDKFLKIIWLIVGLIVLSALVIAIIFAITDLIHQKQSINDTVIIGHKLKNAIKEGKTLQGMEYEQFDRIGISNKFYLPISSMTYEEAKVYKGALSSGSDMSYRFGNIINILFLDSAYNVLNTLVDFKARISNIEYPTRLNKEDKTEYMLTYLIGTEDSNKNGLLDIDDNHNLYVSEIDGTGLKRISENIDIEQFRHVRNNTQLLISYFERNNEKKEHQRKKFALYDFKLDSLIKLNKIDAELDKIEHILISD